MADYEPLQPVVLMVCAPCREDEGQRLMCAEPGCAFSDYENGDPLRPVRSREDMIQAAAHALWSSDGVPDTQKRARAVLLAVGVIGRES